MNVRVSVLVIPVHVVTKLIVLRGLLVVRLRLVIGRRWVVRGWSGMDGMMSQRSGMNGMGDGGSMDGMVGDRMASMNPTHCWL